MTQSTSQSPRAMADEFAKVSSTYGGHDDPYPMYREHRENMPVMEGDILAKFGIPSQADYANKGRKVWTLFRYDDVMKVLRDQETYSSQLLQDGLGGFLDGVMITAMDGEEHRTLRNTLQGCFTPATLRRWNDTMIDPVIRQEYVDTLKDGKRAELVTAMAMDFPVRVIYEILGFPNDRKSIEQFAGWALRILAGPQLDPELAKQSAAAAFQAAEDLYQHVRPIVARRRAEGVEGHDLIAYLLRADAQGADLDDHKITNLVRMLLPAAAETTTRSFGNAMVLLLERPELLEQVRQDRSLLPKVVSESLRYEPTAAFLAREAMKDVEFHGVKIPAGSALSLACASANRDESVFKDGDTFDIHRTVRPQLAFGFGPHTCLGMTVARMEIESALNGILDTMPNVRFDPDQPRARIQGMQLRGPSAIHVVWD